MPLGDIFSTPEERSATRREPQMPKGEKVMATRKDTRAMERVPSRLFLPRPPPLSPRVPHFYPLSAALPSPTPTMSTAVTGEDEAIYPPFTRITRISTEKG